MIIGYTTIAMVLIVVGIDVSKVFLARRALGSAADAAALAGAQGVDTRAIYAGMGLRCGRPLPLASGHVADLADDSVRDETRDLRSAFASLDPPRTSAAGGTVGVELSGDVAVPFGHVLAWLDPSLVNGEVHVTAIAHARSPVAGGAGCG